MSQVNCANCGLPDPCVAGGQGNSYPHTRPNGDAVRYCSPECGVALKAEDLAWLIEWARTYIPTPAEKRAAKVSFVYGNLRMMHNASVTRAEIERALVEAEREQE